MEYNQRTYFRDDSESDVSAIIVVECDDDQIRVTENRSDVHWSAPFWMPEGEFRASVHQDDVEEVGIISADKFEKVMNIARA